MMCFGFLYQFYELVNKCKLADGASVTPYVFEKFYLLLEKKKKKVYLIKALETFGGPWHQQDQDSLIIWLDSSSGLIISPHKMMHHLFFLT